MNPQLIARVGLWLNPLTAVLPARAAIYAYSRGKHYFMEQFYRHKVAPINLDNQKWQRNLWGIDFRLPLMGSAGIFRNARGYDVAANQGAGGYISGTNTYNPRDGNTKLGISHPFLSMPKSNLSLNYFGLPNLGDKVLSARSITDNKITGCPIGCSVMRSPDYAVDESMEKLVESLWLYHDNLQIDFIEINESCPNIAKVVSESSLLTSLSRLENRLKFITQNFIIKRKRHLPVILKLSTDLNIDELPKLLDTVFLCKFDGINLGNTSTLYSEIIIHNYNERRLFNYFTKHVGGGIGGQVLKQKSLYYAAEAVRYRDMVNPDYEFHIIRTGGITTFQDIIDSENAGISLNQWYTGYFENYIKHGDLVYKDLFERN